ncbi:MAG: SPOR domain-containing protein [Burkholderiales bacterium]
MADEPFPDEASALRKRALTRLAVAVVLVGVAGGALYFLNRSEAPAPQPAPVETVLPPEPLPPPEEMIEAEPPPPPEVLNETPAAEAQPASPPVALPPAVTEGAPPPAAQSAPPAQEKPPLKPFVPREFVVQIGVFSDPGNAQLLQNRLAEQGIKSVTETRLKLEPFKTRTEAEAVLAKLKEMGVKAVVIAR